MDALSDLAVAAGLATTGLAGLAASAIAVGGLGHLALVERGLEPARRLLGRILPLFLLAWAPDMMFRFAGKEIPDWTMLARVPAAFVVLLLFLTLLYARLFATPGDKEADACALRAGGPGPSKDAPADGAPDAPRPEPRAALRLVRGDEP